MDKSPALSRQSVPGFGLHGDESSLHAPSVTSASTTELPLTPVKKPQQEGGIPIPPEVDRLFEELLVGLLGTLSCSF